MKTTIVNDIQKKAFEFLMDQTNLNEASRGYGLTADHSARSGLASIAATGFFLSALVIGVEYNYIDKPQALRIAQKTLITLDQNIPHFHGFFAHFLEIETGERHKKCEYSTIDTALALCGVLTVDSYFKDPLLSHHAKRIFDRIDWTVLTFEKQGKKLLHMSYNPDKGGDYVEDKPGFIHQWDMFAEQIMMYVMIAGSSHKDNALDLYHGFTRISGTYEGHHYIYSPGNSLFVYQFPLAWLNIEGMSDDQGVRWFENAKTATLAHYQAARNHQHLYQTFSDHFFGFSASDTPKGYRVYGGLPNTLGKLDTDGTMTPFAAIGSLPLTPDISLKAIDEMLKIDGLWGSFGFYDAFNFENNQKWISARYYAINKGLELLMTNAYLTKDVQKAFMTHPIVMHGIKVLGWKKDEDTTQK
jgi:hypothetical protein